MCYDVDSAAAEGRKIRAESCVHRLLVELAGGLIAVVNHHPRVPENKESSLYIPASLGVNTPRALVAGAVASVLKICLGEAGWAIEKSASRHFKGFLANISKRRDERPGSEYIILSDLFVNDIRNFRDLLVDAEQSLTQMLEEAVPGASRMSLGLWPGELDGLEALELQLRMLQGWCSKSR